uniref:Alpha-1-B glycoprotein n=1 Tax=Equus asinus asinus TaxID=83772 RepID=A0A8C4PTW9_EQUAS
PTILATSLLILPHSLGTGCSLLFDPQPALWAEADWQLEPWTNLMLTCQARLQTKDFQLFKDGVAQEPVQVGSPTIEHQFPLGAVTSDTRGLYRCRSGLDSGWTQLSNLVEVTGAESLPPPLLSTEPVSWITPGLNTTLRCQGGLRGVTFLLRREGDDQFLEVAEAPEDVVVTFPVHLAGNYSCSYRTHAAGDPSGPSAPVTIEELASAQVLRPGVSLRPKCAAPLGGVDFQLRRGEQELLVPMSSAYPDRVSFHLDALAPGDSGLYTCRYRLRDAQRAWSWSGDSAPVELLLSDETLPAPELSAEPATPDPAAGARVQLRCRAPRAGLRFALVREDAGGRRALQLLSPAGPEATFELNDVSVLDSANYSCVYADRAPPFAGSAPSKALELRVRGPPPRPQLRALWSGAVTPGRDATLRCEGQMPDVTFELLRVGDTEASAVAWAQHRHWADLVLSYVGPQHAGKYSCRYRAWRPSAFQSELSDPVELQVAGEVPLGSSSRLAGLCPSAGHTCLACRGARVLAGR